MMPCGVVCRGAWDKVGSVVGGPEDTDDTMGVPSKWHNGRQYDFVVDVDFEDGVPPKKLAFNRDDNPYDVAERSDDHPHPSMLSRHHLLKLYSEDWPSNGKILDHCS